MSETRKQHGETKCCTCQRGPRSECAWFAWHKPVHGWTAKRSDVLTQTKVTTHGKYWYYRHYEESYHVIDCPLYLKDDRMEPERHGVLLQEGLHGGQWDLQQAGKVLRGG